LFLFALLGLDTGAIYALAGQGLVLVYRGSGVLNFAQGAIAAIGALAYYGLHVESGLPVAVAIAAALLISGAAGALMHLLVMRPLRNAPALTRVIATLGVMIALQQAGTIAFGMTIRTVPSFHPSASMRIGGTAVGEDRLLLLVIALVVSAVLWLVYRYSKFGAITSAVAESERAAQLAGHSPDVIAAANWILGAMLAGAAGILVAPIIGLDTNSLVLLIIPALATGVVASFDSFLGALAASLVIGIAQAEITHYVSAPGWDQAVPFLFVILVLVLRGHALPLRSHVNELLPEIGSGLLRPVRICVAVAVMAVLIIVTSATWSPGHPPGHRHLRAGVLCAERPVPERLPRRRARGNGGEVADGVRVERGHGAVPEELRHRVPGGPAGDRAGGGEHPARAFGPAAGRCARERARRGLARGQRVRRQAVRVRPAGGHRGAGRRAARLPVDVHRLQPVQRLQLDRGRDQRRDQRHRVPGGRHPGRGSAAGGVVPTIFCEFIASGSVNQYVTLALAVLLVPTLISFPNGLAAWLVTWRLPASIQGRLAGLRLPGPRRFGPASADGGPAVAPPRAHRVAPLVLEVRDISVSYGGVKALAEVSVEVHPGEVVGIMGPNGAGKTTFIDAITGFTRIRGGSILLAGKRIDRLSPHKRARLGIGRSFQSLELFDQLTVIENLRTASDPRNADAYLTDLVWPKRAALTPAARSAISMFGLADDLHRVPSELPYGRRRQVAISGPSSPPGRRPTSARTRGWSRPTWARNTASRRR